MDVTEGDAGVKDRLGDFSERGELILPNNAFGDSEDSAGFGRHLFKKRFHRHVGRHVRESGLAQAVKNALGLIPIKGDGIVIRLLFKDAGGVEHIEGGREHLADLGDFSRVIDRIELVAVKIQFDFIVFSTHLDRKREQACEQLRMGEFCEHAADLRALQIGEVIGFPVLG